MRLSLRNFLWAVAIVGAASAAFHGLGLANILPWHIVYSDTLGFYERVIQPGFPYIEKQIEYPVLTGLFMNGVAALAPTRAGYYILNSFLLIFAAIFATMFLYKTVPPESRGRIWRYWIFAPSMLLFAVYNWDMLAVLFVVVAIYFERKKNYYAAAACVALGFSAKFFPLILLAPLLLEERIALKEKVKTLAMFLTTVIAVNGFFWIKNFNGWLYFFTFNSARNSNPDSIWTIVRFLFGEIGTPFMNAASAFIFAASFLFVLIKFRKAGFVALSFAGILLFLLTNKIFSPQYLLWLLPFAVLLPVNGRWFYAAEFGNIIALFLALRWFIVSPDINYFYVMIPFVLLRHAALIAMLVFALKKSFAFTLPTPH